MQPEPTTAMDTASNLMNAPRAIPSARALAAEAVGTYVLVAIGTGAVIADAARGGQLGSWGIGFAFFVGVALPVYVLGRVSGAHINPAVTMAFAVLGAFPARAVFPYIAAQLAGAIAASATLSMAAGTVGNLGATTPSGPAAESLLVETLIAFILMFVIALATRVARPSRLMTALLIGGTVGAIAAFAGPISGASMNPARTLGPAVVSGVFTHHWVYWAGPMGGTCLAAMIFRNLTRSLPSEES